MSGSKHFDKIAWTVTALILVATILFMNGGALGLEAIVHTMGYENRLFDKTKVHTVDIVMDDWDKFIIDAASEEYYASNVVIDGESYKNVGLRAKGNTSLSTVAYLGSERYSFKIEFDHYDSAKSYHGLDKLSLNNLIQDSTMMKDYLTYAMMNEFGVNSSLCSYAYITVNGKDWGLYLAVEGVEDAFLKRNYGSNYGELYKPDSMSFGGGRGNGRDFDMKDFTNRDESTDSSDQGMTMPPMPDMGNFDPSQIPEGFDKGMPDIGGFDFSQIPGRKRDQSDDENSGTFFGGRDGFGGMGSSDVKLQYIDDDLESYSNIWNNAKTDITKTDQKRLVESLRKLSSVEQIESVVDIEQVIRYFVVHNYVCNDDSYTGMMIHNYYLYEENGRMAMIPWDYNLAFGTFTAMDANSTVNTPIDNPVSSGSSDRPMLNWIFESEEYTAMYHQYFAEFLDTVDIQAIIKNTYCLIQPYVEKDPTAFYDFDEFELGVQTLEQFCKLRSESVSMQLKSGETTDDMGYADASAISLKDMGAMNGGMGNDNNNMFNMPGGAPFQQEGTDEATVNEANRVDSFTSAAGTFGQFNEGAGTAPPGDAESTPSNTPEKSPIGDANQDRPSRGNMQMPEGNFNPIMKDMDNSASNSANWIWIAVSVLILGVGLAVAKLYKR